MVPKSISAVLVAVMVFGCALPVRAEIVVSGGWVRETVPGATTGAGYFTITNTGPVERKLLRLTTPVCDMLSLHQSSVDAQGMARMWPMAWLTLAPGQTMKFEPNGRHLMFMDLQRPFRPGEHVPVTFQFDGGETVVTAQFEVRGLLDDGKGASDHAQHRVR